ncbi:DNA methyltransferase [Actinosynnema sp. NPDC059797]
MQPNPQGPQLRRNIDEFYAWRLNHLKGDEKGEAQIFLDRLFRAFGHAGIKEAGATLEERIKKNDVKGTAFADLMWKPRCLVEMKKSGSDLKRHYRQAFDYWVNAVPNRPRYVVLCNFDEFWVYDFDSQMDAPVEQVSLDQLASRWESLAFLLPEEKKPSFGNDLVAVTREAAAAVAGVFGEMHQRGVRREVAQRFVLQSVMAMFAEDIGLLPAHFFTAALDDSLATKKPTDTAYDLLFNLFREMNTAGFTAGGRYRGTPYFNGGLFADINPFDISKDELQRLRQAANTDWSAVRPEIFGTLFEQSMDKDERHASGAHFTSQADIAKVVGPTIVTPWRERIAEARTRGSGGIEAMNKVLADMFTFRVLDPACGSGNFLYVAYREMRRLEHEALIAVSEMRRNPVLALQGTLSYVTPDHFFGIDVNPFAVELAKVTMMLAKKLSADELGDDRHVLPLDNLSDTIRATDALFSPWPKADAIIGNPPFLGRRFMVGELGADYCHKLAERHPNVSGVSDFVTYWFPLAHDRLPSGGRAGFVATNSIRQVHSRKASLDYIVDNGGVIYDAVSTQPWAGDAKVFVSIVNWIKDADVTPKVLWLNDGDLRLEVDTIPTSLSPTVDVRGAQPLLANQRPQRCFQGQTPGVTRGDGFVIGEAQAVKLGLDSGHIHPFLGGDELLWKSAVDRYVIDVAIDDVMSANADIPAIMKYLRASVLPKREEAASKESARNAKILNENPKAKVNKHHANFLARWWKLAYRREDLLREISTRKRYIATSRVASLNRLAVFEFVDSAIHPGDALTVFAMDDDYSLGVLSSSVHHDWTRARCSTFKGDPRYTSTTVFDSFPWPQSPSVETVKAVAEVSAEIVSRRAAMVARGVMLGDQYDSLRTPGKNWLRDLHEELDRLVLQAYGFSSQESSLAQILAINQDLASNTVGVREPGGHHWRESQVSEHRLLPPEALRRLDS